MEHTTSRFSVAVYWWWAKKPRMGHKERWAAVVAIGGWGVSLGETV